jgi:DNA adenine methylase
MVSQLLVENPLVDLRPPLKWAGGKRWLVPELEAIWVKHSDRRMVEPFVGGFSVPLGLKPQHAILNDTNPHLMNFYQWLQKGVVIPPYFRMENDEKLYYANRERFNELIAKGEHLSGEAASLFYFLNRTGYNGLCRFNKKGFFNVPFGRYKKINYTRDFFAYQTALSRWDLRTGDFEKISLKPGDFVYADPPYDVPFTSYSAGGFSWEDQLRLAKWLSQHDGPVLISNQATPRVIKLYRKLGFKLRFFRAPRRIACTGDRAPAREILAMLNL